MVRGSPWPGVSFATSAAGADGAAGVGGAGQVGEQPGDLVVGLRRVAETRAGRDDVAVAPPVPGPAEVPVRLQVRDDRLHGALGQTALRRDVAQPDARVARDGDQNPGMVRQEGPAVAAGARVLALHTVILEG